MKYAIPALILICTATVSAQNDPFYTDEPSAQAVEKSEKNAKIQAEITACLPPNPHRITLATPFAQLKLVGIAELHGQFRALFLDEQQRIIDLKAGDFLENSQIQVTEISLKAVEYIDWQHSRSCAEPTHLQLKL